MNEPHVNGVPLQEYIEKRMADQARALDIASTEREKSAAALRDEQSRAMNQAEREREKAAAAMRENLDRAIREGDERLREHIANQISQIQAALTSADKLEIQRVKTAEESTEGLRREMNLITTAAQEAIKKAEDAQKDVNSKSNEFRGQLSDQASTFMPRRESESRSLELDRRIEEGRTERERLLSGVNDRISTLERGESGRGARESAFARHEDRVQPWQLWIAGGLLTIIIILSSYLLNH